MRKCNQRIFFFYGGKESMIFKLKYKVDSMQGEVNNIGERRYMHILFSLKE